VKLIFSLSGMATPIAANHIHKNINFKTQPHSRLLFLRKIPLVLHCDNVFLELFNKVHYHGKITTCSVSYMCSVAKKSETSKQFLQITIPALILKSYNSGKTHFIWHSRAFRPASGYIFASFHFQCFGKTREALRDLTWPPLQKNLRLDKKISCDYNPIFHTKMLSLKSRIYLTFRVILYFSQKIYVKHMKFMMCIFGNFWYFRAKYRWIVKFFKYLL